MGREQPQIMVLKESEELWEAHKSNGFGKENKEPRNTGVKISTVQVTTDEQTVMTNSSQKMVHLPKIGENTGVKKNISHKTNSLKDYP